VKHALVMTGNTAAAGRQGKALSTVIHTNHGTYSFGLSIAKWRAQNQCTYSLYDKN